MNHLAIARKMRDITQTELAGRLNVTQTQIANWESGFRLPNSINIKALAAALDVDEAWIAGHPTSIPVPDPVNGGAYNMPVIRAEEIPDYGTLYIVYNEFENGPLAVIVGGGVVIVPRDWGGQQYLSAAEIMEEDDPRVGQWQWVAPDGSQCVILDGLPRVGWWV